MSGFFCTFAVAKVFTMEDNFAIQLFEGKKVRIVWDEEQEKYWFSVVDIVQVLTGSFDYQQARKYWKVLKGRLIKEGNESVTNCYQLKLPSSDGKKYMTDVADLQGIFRIIQSIPSKKAEPVKQWLAQLGEQRIDQMIDPELTLTTELSRQRNPKGMVESKQAAQAGGKVAKNAREDLERQLGRSVISSERASDYLRPIEEGNAQELPFDEDKDK